MLNNLQLADGMNKAKSLRVRRLPLVSMTDQWTVPSPLIGTPWATPLSCRSGRTFRIDPTKSDLVFDTAILAPESQMMGKLDEFWFSMADLNLAGAWRAIFKASLSPSWLMRAQS